MNISKNESVTMKAFAIIFVILAHILNNCIGERAIKVSALLGTGGVWIFLILSGYGLFCSYKNKGIELKSYWNNKINNILGPYALITIVYYVWMRVTGKYISIAILAKNILCVDFDRNMDGTMWYMSFLIMWYALFFVIFYFDYPTIFKVNILFVCGFIFSKSYYGECFSECNWQFVTNAYAFPIGAFLGYLGNKKRVLEFIKKLRHIWKYMILLATITVYLMGCFEKLNLTYGQYGVLLFFGIYFYIKVCSEKPNLFSKILYVIGKHSYILYLLEGKIMSVLAIYFLPDNPILFAVGMIILTGLFAWAYHMIKNSKVYSIIREC